MISPSTFLPNGRCNHKRKKHIPAVRKHCLLLMDKACLLTLFSNRDKCNFWCFLILASNPENGVVCPNSTGSLFRVPGRSCSAKVVFLEYLVFTWYLQFWNVLVIEKCQIAFGLFSSESQSLGCCCVWSCNGSSKRSGMWWCALLLFSTPNGCASSCIQIPARISWGSLCDGMFYTEL